MIAPITFTGSYLGISWTNSEPSIGLAASGNSELPLFTATNTGVTPVVATVTVTPLYNNNVSCAGTPVTFTITVKPTPDIDPVASQTICSGGNTTAIIFNGHVANTMFSWINNNPNIGLVNVGNGNIPSFTGYQSYLATGQNVGYINVTPTANSCIGTVISFTIGINAEPFVENINSQTVCNGAATSLVNFSNPVTGTVYNWTNSNPSIGLAASGNGNIPFFVAINTGTTSTSGIISVTPVTNSNGVLCEGLTKTFTYLVAPTALVNTVPDKVFCNDAENAVISLSANMPGAGFNWTNSNTAIGLPASFGGSDVVFTPTNTGNTPITATITVMTILNGCVGEPKTFTITVNPRPVINSIQNRIFCSAQSTVAIPFTGTATSFTWTNNKPSIGLAASGSGNIAPFNAINTGSSPVTAIITVVPSYSNAGVTCTGISRTFTITIEPAKTINASAGANGNISPAGTTFVSCDGSGNQVYNITANGCFQVLNVLVDGVSQGAITTYTFSNVSSNHTISATFEVSAPLSAPTVTGPVNVCPYVGSGTTVTYTATSAGTTGYTWTLPPNVSLVSSSNNSITVKFLPGFTAQASKQIRVKALSSCGFSAQTIYYLAAQSPGTAGSISGNTNVCPIIGTVATYTYSN